MLRRSPTAPRDLATRQVSTLTLKGLEQTLPRQAAAFAGKPIVLHEQTVAPGTGEVRIAVELPPGHKLNTDAPFYAAWSAPDPQVVAFEDTRQSATMPNPAFPLSIRARFGEGQTDLVVDLAVYHCREGEESLCFVDLAQVRVPVRVAAGVTGRLVVVDYIVDVPETARV